MIAKKENIIIKEYAEINGCLIAFVPFKELPLVRCGNCKNWIRLFGDEGQCCREKQLVSMNRQDFCSKGIDKNEREDL